MRVCTCSRPLASPITWALWVFLLAGAIGQAGATEQEILGGHEGWLDRMGGGIRELGMGNAGTASEEAMPAAYWNPAVLPFEKRTAVGLGADVRSLQRNGGYAALQGRVAANLGMGVGLINRGDWQVDVYDEDEHLRGTARPQAIGSWVGLGVKTSRVNAFGAAVQWYSADLDYEDGTGNVNVIGVVNLGWYRRFGERLRAAVVVRNLGLNSDLSARIDQTTVTGEEDASGFDHTSTDFFPKTLVLAGQYTLTAWNRKWDLGLEALDYQLKDGLYSLDANFHHQAFRAGVECHVTEALGARGGFDGGNLSLGMGYVFPWGRNRLAFDYALLLERGWLTVNPFAVGLRYHL